MGSHNPYACHNHIGFPSNLPRAIHVCEGDYPALDLLKRPAHSAKRQAGYIFVAILLVSIFVFWIVHINEAFDRWVISSAKSHSPYDVNIIPILNVTKEIKWAAISARNSASFPTADYANNLTILYSQKFRGIRLPGFSDYAFNSIGLHAIRRNCREKPIQSGESSIAFNYCCATTPNIRNNKLNFRMNSARSEIIPVSFVKRYSTNNQPRSVRGEILPSLKPMLLFSEVSLHPSQGHLLFSYNACRFGFPPQFLCGAPQEAGENRQYESEKHQQRVSNFDAIPIERRPKLGSAIVSMLALFGGIVSIGISGRRAFVKVGWLMICLGVVLIFWGSFGFLFGFDLWNLWGLL